MEFVNRKPINIAMYRARFILQTYKPSQLGNMRAWTFCDKVSQTNQREIQTVHIIQLAMESKGIASEVIGTA
jgi:hypothetical protein